MTPRALLILCLTLSAPALAQPSSPDAELTRYLESRDLRRPLMDHLESLLATAPSSEKSELAERLAALYAEAIERAATPVERDAYERRARALLDALPDDESIDLRLALARASYARAEDSAERWRLRLADPSVSEDTARSLSTLLADLTKLASAAHRRVEALERQEETARNLDSSVLTDALSAARRQRSLANYLAGWAGVYLAELSPQRAGVLAADSAKRFGWLLNAPQNELPPIDRVPESTLRLEHVARAAMGVGVAASLRDEYTLALRWFDLLERVPDVPAPVRDQVLTRRISAAARAGEWTDLLHLVQVARAVETPTGAKRDVPPTRLAPPLARLLAVLAFEPPRPPRSTAVVQTLRTIAIADLVAQSELAQVVDLTSRYGTEPLGAEGFIPLYIRGLQAYQSARDLHASRAPDREQPTTDADIVALYKRAAELLKGALNDASTDSLPSARADAALMLAGAAFYTASNAAEANEAADRFERAITLADTPARAADAHWMSIRALDHALKQPPSSRPAPQRDAAARREAAAADFIRRFPDDSRTTLLILERSASGALAPEDAAQALLSVSRDSPSWPAARREAARLLYNQARAAPIADRPLLVARFAALAEDAFADEARAARAGNADAGARALLLARQSLDLLLADPPDAPRARRILDALEALEPTVNLAPVRAELLFRALQIALASDNIPAARRAADSLRLSSDSAALPFTRAADQLLLRRALTSFRAAPNAPDARDVLHLAPMLLPADASPDPANLPILLSIAEAGHWLWDNEHDATARDAALNAARRAQSLEPNAHPILVRRAQLAEASALPDEAAEAWSAIIAAAELGSEQWFDATTNLLRLLSTHDPARAKDLLRKHRVLFPKLGPAPWDERLTPIANAIDEGAGTP
ncbi:MAG: hypothetical protein AB7G17_00290 [Phycisphaerales bacterium]